MTQNINQSANQNNPASRQDQNFKVLSLQTLMQACQNIGQIDSVKKKLSSFEKPKKLKIVVDCANGMGGFVMPYIKNLYSKNPIDLESLSSYLEQNEMYSKKVASSKNPSQDSHQGKNLDLSFDSDIVEWVILYDDVDGNYPNHPADPMDPKNLIDLQNKVLETKADFGAAFDGDADRVFFVDDQARPINTELLIAIFAKKMLSRLSVEGSIESYTGSNKYQLNPVVVTCMSYSRALADVVYQSGAAVVPSIQGHTYMKANMSKYQAIYGAEGSGHHYFGEFGFMDSGAITLCLFISCLTDSLQKTLLDDNLKSTKDQDASQKNNLKNEDDKAITVLQGLDKYYFTSGEKNYKIPSKLNMEIVKTKLKNHFLNKKYTQNLSLPPQVSEIDGISIYFTNQKLTVRGSNTEPLIRINTESLGQNMTGLLVDEILQVLGIF